MSSSGPTDRRRPSRARLALPVLVAALLLLGCAGFIGAGVTVAFLGAAALGLKCDDPLDVTVFDGVTGERTCDADVIATDEDGSERRLQPCYAAELGEGTWTVRAALEGRQPAYSRVVVGARGRVCDRAVHSVELTLAAPATSPPRRVAVPTGNAEQLPAAAPAPAPSAPPPPAREADAGATSGASESAPSDGGVPTARFASDGAPPTGWFGGK